MLIVYCIIIAFFGLWGTTTLSLLIDMLFHLEISYFPLICWYYNNIFHIWYQNILTKICWSTPKIFWKAFFILIASSNFNLVCNVTKIFGNIKLYCVECEFKISGCFSVTNWYTIPIGRPIPVVPITCTVRCKKLAHQFNFF